VSRPVSESADERLRQATCAILVDSQVRGTAWLLNREGLLLTAGHVLGESNPLDKVQVRFPEDVPRDAYKIVWFYQPEAGVDFAVLKMASSPDDREPLPISLDREVTGEFRVRGYGRSLLDQSCGLGEIVGTFDPQNQPALRLLRLRSPELAEPGYSGGAVFIDQANAVVGLQTEAAQATAGAGRDTVLAMPLYRIAQIWDPLMIVSRGRSVVSVQQAAGLTPLLNPPPDKPARPRFVIRREWFGSFVWDTQRLDYIPFDADGTDIFYSGRFDSLESIQARQAARYKSGEFETFIDLCRSIELLDEEGKFNGRFINNVPPLSCLSAPLRIYLSVTRACNFSCQHCYSSSGNPYPDELTTSEIKRLLDEMATMGTFQLWIGGGEPLVRADLPELIGHANSLDIEVCVSTNAVAATPAVVDSLRSVKVATFKVSVEGASPAVFDAIRGEPGSLQAALRGIENLFELRTPILLSRVFMRPNMGEARALIKLAEQIGAANLALDTVMPVGRAAAHPELVLDPEETDRLWKEVEELRKTTRVRVQILRQVPFDVGKLGWWSGFGCKCGNTICHIDPRGNVAPSGYLHGIKHSGNIRQQSLKQIWDTGAGLNEFRGLGGNTVCNVCSYAGRCRGGCRARTLLAEQNINMPDPYCLVEQPQPEQNAIEADAS
jgi:AdoMet-dependent heme synthase